MLRRRTLRIGSAVAALAGLGGIVALVAYRGFAEVMQILLSASWGIALVVALHLLTLSSSAIAWRSLAGAVAQGPASVFVWARVVREAANALLPVAQVGGDIVGARILTFHGTRAPVAAASVLVDLTLEFVTQIVFTIFGLAVLFAAGGGDLVGPAAAGVLFAILAAAGFLLAQRSGIFLLLEKFLGHAAGILKWPELGSLATLHDTAMAIYSDRRATVSATFWHLASWVLGAVEVWVTFLVLGADVSFLEALVVESLGQAVRTAAFLVPGAYGIQEGGYMLLGVHFGVAPEIALSVSLVKRVRELVLGVPPLLIWQYIEYRRLFAVSEPATKENA